MPLAGKTLFITGASRGIGLAIARRAARGGANVAMAAKTAAPDPASRHHPTAAEEIEKAGGAALPLEVDAMTAVRGCDRTRTARHLAASTSWSSVASAIALAKVAGIPI
jgi:citronellol/citronellal dehydrogenase